jgi:hypothetical protein
MTIQILGNGNPDGTGVVQSATEKVHLYGGTAVAQAATIATSASTLVSLKAKLNSLLTACRNIGLIAAS